MPELMRIVRPHCVCGRSFGRLTAVRRAPLSPWRAIGIEDGTVTARIPSKIFGRSWTRYPLPWSGSS